MLANRLEVVHIGTAYAATMSMIATTIINSSNENPSWPLRIRLV
jgi:hypothetical protein